jgi:hypothetical protein
VLTDVVEVEAKLYMQERTTTKLWLLMHAVKRLELLINQFQCKEHNTFFCLYMRLGSGLNSDELR